MKLVLTVFYVLLMAANLFSQTSGISVEYITAQDGLANNKVNCILKDQTGFMWFGTNDGLTRYDGYSLKNFRPLNEFLVIFDLHETPDGLLWCASSIGLYCFDLETEHFIATFKTTSDTANALPDNNINGIAAGAGSSLWLATNNGLCHLENISRSHLEKSSTRITIFNTENSAILSNSLTAIEHDEEGAFWLGTSDKLLQNFDPIANRSLSLPSSIVNAEKRTITRINTLFTINNTIWAGTMGGGIIRLNKTTRKLDVLTRKETGKISLSHDDVYGIQMDGWENVWIGTWDGIDRIHAFSDPPGISVIDNFNKNHLYFNENLENRISSVFYDDSGVMWLGTFGGGVVKINIHSSFYKRIEFDSRIEVKAFAEDPDGYLWISTYHGGIKKTREKAGTTDNYSFTNFTKEGKNDLHSNIILCSAKDVNGNFWFGSYESTLYFYNYKLQQFKEISVTPENDKNWKGKINTLCFDTDNFLWIGTSNGLILYDLNLKEFHRISPSDLVHHGLNDIVIQCILKDSKGNIWVGTGRGVNKLIYRNEKNFHFQKFNDLQIPAEKLPMSEVRAIYEDKKQRLWFGYLEGGVGLLDQADEVIEFYNTRDGLCNNFVACITEDNNGNLWLGTNSGISQFNPDTEKFKNYFIANNNRAAYKDGHGNIYFGNNHGFLYFNPDSIHLNQFVTPAVISNIKVRNMPVPLNEKINGQIILTKAIQYTQQIKLNYLNNDFSLDLVALSYLSQDLNKYAYILEGLHEYWNEVDARSRTITYNNLKPGNYTFRVKASNNDGIWSTKEHTLEIIVSPPWWNATWFISALLIAILAIIFVAFNLRIKYILTKQQELRTKAELENKLKISRIEQQKEKELSEVKMKFFTNISHEFRTPLTLILSPLTELIDSEQIPYEIKKRLKPIRKNSTKLLNLINQLLDLRKIDTHKMELKVGSNNINSFVKTIFKSFKPLALQNNINYTFVPIEKSALLWFDADKMETVISNLLSNAFKFTPPDGTITVKIDSTKNEAEKHMAIAVSDSGKGILKKEQKNIFNRFYQVEENGETRKSGTGIGLSLVHEIVKLHKGEVQVESVIGKGTTFTVLLPMGKAHFSSDQVLFIKAEENVVYVKPEVEIDDPEIASEEIAAGLSGALKKGTIVLVEDNLEVLAYTKIIFQDEYQVFTATNGKEGLRLVKQHLPDLVISDIMMPIMDGIELCTAIKTTEISCHIPVILLTAKVADFEITKGLETGADDYVLKPFTNAVLKAKVGSIIKSRKQLKEFYSKKISLEPTDIEVEPGDEKFLKHAIALIERNLTNPEFSVNMLAENLNMSQATLYRKIKSFTNHSISEFIRSIRLKRAAQLIHSKEYSISEISDMVGFSDQNYFRKCFLKQFGVNPSEYQKGENKHN